VVLAEGGNDRLRLISGGTITTIAGTRGMGGYAGDGTPASAALIDAPSSVVTWRDDHVVFVQAGTLRAGRRGADAAAVRAARTRRPSAAEGAGGGVRSGVRTTNARAVPCALRGRAPLSNPPRRDHRSPVEPPLLEPERLRARALAERDRRHSR